MIVVLKMDFVFRNWVFIVNISKTVGQCKF